MSITKVFSFSATATATATAIIIIIIIIITSSNQRLWECVRRRINFYTDTLNDFPS